MLPASAFNDITSGDNSCTEGGCSAGCSGFAAVPGWDAATVRGGLAPGCLQRGAFVSRR